jgi:hypothetical protein
MIEVRWENEIISFDGRVIEDFGMSQEGSVRHHIAHVKAAELRVDKKGRYSIFISIRQV